mmetsp:Transcript_23688/g.70297  ORF Transcript_23688/g.70297 Transcript_23688/m.70297 type:complete len:271 (-) Transcript_23688:18-830(-)
MLKQLRPSEPVGRFLVQQALEEGLELGADIRGELHRVLDDVVDEAVDAIRVERRGADVKLKEDDTEGPEVNRVVVRLLLHQFWCHVERRALDGRENHGVARHGAGKPKVAQLHRAVAANQDVLRLHVSVDDAVRVQVVQCTHKLLRDALDHLLRKALVVLQDFKQLSLSEFSHHTEVCLSLKCVQHLDDVFVPQRPQNLNLLAQVFDVLLTLAMLVDEFHGSDLTGALSPALIHLSKRALSNEVYNMVIVHPGPAAAIRTDRCRGCCGSG